MATLGIAVAAVGQARADGASTPASAVAGDYSLHLGGGFALPTRDGDDGRNPGWAELDAGAGYRLGRRLEIELGLGWSLAGSRLIRSGDGAGQEELTTGVGAIARALVRWHFLDGPWRPFVAVGPALAFAGRYGAVALGQGEAGIQWGGPRGLYLEAALRAHLPLHRSRVEIDPDRCLTRDCPSRFHPGGGPILGSRLAVGFAF